MTAPSEARRIRAKTGMSLSAFAKALRLADRSAVHRWETGSRAVSGPVSILYELLDAGELPARYLGRHDGADLL